MSTPDDSNTHNTKEPEEESSADEPNEMMSHGYQAKLIVHRRDRYRCCNCREGFDADDVSHLDADHIVPEGVGGANTLSNLGTLCRRCHEAKHGEREHAPTIRAMSTGDMINKDFRWFVHFWKEILPALAEAATGHRVEPKHRLDEESPYQAWHIPIGDLRRLDELLGDMDEINYAAQGLHQYM